MGQCNASAGAGAVPRLALELPEECGEALVQAGFGDEEAADVRFWLVEGHVIAEDAGCAEAGRAAEGDPCRNVPFGAAIAAEDGVALAVRKQRQPVGDAPDAANGGVRGQRRELVVQFLATPARGFRSDVGWSRWVPRSTALRLRRANNSSVAGCVQHQALASC